MAETEHMLTAFLPHTELLRTQLYPAKGKDIPKIWSWRSSSGGSKEVQTVPILRPADTSPLRPGLPPPSPQAQALELAKPRSGTPALFPDSTS